MTGWVARRFWTAASVETVEAGFSVSLDGKPVRTPARRVLLLPTRAVAEAIAAEWDAQGTTVRPDTMPFTRTANSALDKVAPQFDDVAAMLADYGGTDLLCYRAAGPAALVARQAAGWDPLLDWLAATFGARLRATEGVTPVAQDPGSLARLAARVARLTPFQLAAFHDLVAISGSLVLALAVAEGRLPPEEAWSLSRIDETWQVEQWGEDAEAAQAEAEKRKAFHLAARFFTLCG